MPLAPSLLEMIPAWLTLADEPLDETLAEPLDEALDEQLSWFDTLDASIVADEALKEALGCIIFEV
jgi:hypothetical protein